MGGFIWLHEMAKNSGTRAISKIVRHVTCMDIIRMCGARHSWPATAQFRVLAGAFFRKAAENQMKRQQNELAQSILEARFAKTSSCSKLSSPSDTATLSRRRILAKWWQLSYNPTTSHHDPSLLQSYRTSMWDVFVFIEVWWKSRLNSLKSTSLPLSCSLLLFEYKMCHVQPDSFAIFCPYRHRHNRHNPNVALQFGPGDLVGSAAWMVRCPWRCLQTAKR